jgi:hypothetical protein
MTCSSLATSRAGDLLTGTAFVRRTNTQGGTQPPNAKCRVRTVDQVMEVPYQADYVFFR